MARICRIHKARYLDSVFLMEVTRRLQAEPGITQGAVVMGTPANLKLLLSLGFPEQDLKEAGPDDLVVAGEGEPQALQKALTKVESWLSGERRGEAQAPKTLIQALALNPKANLAVISLPGRYAGKEARRALERGLNVFLFSSNVPLEEEVALKRLAQEKGLIVMGPDCGTAIIAGVGIGFANAVRRGPVGVVAASGTGAQEFTTLMHKAGLGISHVIGVGSHDLSDAVGGISTLCALAALEADPGTQAITLIAKPPSSTVLGLLRERMNKLSKPVVACFLGLIPPEIARALGGRLALTLDEAVVKTLGVLGAPCPSFLASYEASPARLARTQRPPLAPSQRYVRGLFAGGTFCYQAQLLFHWAGIPFRSNAPLLPQYALPDPWRSEGHALVDLGDEAFTEGRAHPMIDPTLRYERILQEAEDPEVAVLLLDFILGHNASVDPVGELLPALAKAQEKVTQRGGHLAVVASVCGVEGDAQGYGSQVEKLRAVGAHVLPTQAQAAGLALSLTQGRHEQ